MLRVSLHQIGVALDVLTNGVTVFQLVTVCHRADCPQILFIVSIHEFATFPSLPDVIPFLCHKRRLVFVPFEAWEDQQSRDNQLQ